MKPRSLNLILLAVLVVAAAFTWVAESDPSEPNTEFLPEMVRSVPFDSFSGNPDLPDGKTLRQPVKGTIPRGFAPIHYSATPEDSLRAADELANPHPTGDDGAVKRGESVYSSFCRHCHGAGGRGDGAVVLRGYPGPPSFFAEEPLARKDGQ
ncbi:MAG: cytochrome c, partial [bacterium]|nr:cytochrome c [bacterium]